MGFERSDIDQSACVCMGLFFFVVPVGSNGSTRFVFLLCKVSHEVACQAADDFVDVFSCWDCLEPFLS